MGWNPALGPSDFDNRADADYLDLSREQEHAFAQGRQSADVRAEQAKVMATDLVLFQFPVWWFSMPAILKGWVDRVFSRSFAYSSRRKYESGHFKGERDALPHDRNSIDAVRAEWHRWRSPSCALAHSQRHPLGYIGFTVLPPSAAWMPARVSAQERQAYLDAFAERLRHIESTEPLFFHPWSDYDESQRLKPGVAARSGAQWNPSAGQTFEAPASSSAQTQTPPATTTTSNAAA